MSWCLLTPEAGTASTRSNAHLRVHSQQNISSAIHYHRNYSQTWYLYSWISLMRLQGTLAPTAGLTGAGSRGLWVCSALRMQLCTSLGKLLQVLTTLTGKRSFSSPVSLNEIHSKSCLWKVASLSRPAKAVMKTRQIFSLIDLSSIRDKAALVYFKMLSFPSL